MKVIRNWADLESFGIICLTGEACGLSMRALCDLTDKGQDLIREFLGLPYNATFQSPWNSKGTGSCFLPWSTFPDLAAFCLIKSGCRLAYHLKTADIYGIEDSDGPEVIEKFTEFHAGDINRQYCTLHVGRTSNEHVMSGRTQ